MKRLWTSIPLLLVLAVSALANAPTSAELLKSAQAQAGKDHKMVMVIFHASWCGWCKKLDAFLADPSMGKLMSDNFVIVHLDVLENAPDKKPLENAGGEELLKQWKGEGLPFTVVLDPKGKKVADSNSDPEKMSNIGYPAKPEEIAHFMKMLKTAPRLSQGQRKSIENWLTANAPKSS
jgi:thioredoxin-related protein